MGFLMCQPQQKGCGCKMVILCRQRCVEFAGVWVVKSFWDWLLHPNVNQAVNCGAPLSRFCIQDNVFLELFQDYLPFSPLRFLSRSRSFSFCAQINQSDFEQRQLSGSKLGLYIHNASSHHHSYPPPQNIHIHTCTYTYWIRQYILICAYTCSTPSWLWPILVFSKAHVLGVEKCKS